MLQCIVSGKLFHTLMQRPEKEYFLYWVLKQWIGHIWMTDKTGWSDEGVSPVCIFLWSIRLFEWLNVLWHKSHLIGSSTIHLDLDEFVVKPGLAYAQRERFDVKLAAPENTCFKFGHCFSMYHTIFIITCSTLGSSWRGVLKL